MRLELWCLFIGPHEDGDWSLEDCSAAVAHAVEKRGIESVTSDIVALLGGQAWHFDGDERDHGSVLVAQMERP